MTTNPSDLIAVQNLVYIPMGLDWSTPFIEKEGTEYGACSFRLNDLSILFRTAKITPTKTGQFVTLWKRTGKSPIHPFDLSDPIDLFVVSTRRNNLLGQFVFPKSVLYKKDIVSKNGQGGKRAIRVYPSWDRPANDQAKKTQTWQLDYFLEISEDQSVDLTRSRKLYQPHNKICY